MIATCYAGSPIANQQLSIFNVLGQGEKNVNKPYKAIVTQVYDQLNRLERMILMPNEKAGGYISQLKFNNGEELDIAENDIVVFVGPNNAGKSQSLKDIYASS